MRLSQSGRLMLGSVNSGTVPTSLLPTHPSARCCMQLQSTTSLKAFPLTALSESVLPCWVKQKSMSRFDAMQDAAERCRSGAALDMFAVQGESSGGVATCLGKCLMSTDAACGHRHSDLLDCIKGFVVCCQTCRGCCWTQHMQRRGTVSAELFFCGASWQSSPHLIRGEHLGRHVHRRRLCANHCPGASAAWPYMRWKHVDASGNKVTSKANAFIVRPTRLQS